MDVNLYSYSRKMIVSLVICNKDAGNSWEQKHYSCLYYVALQRN